MTASTTETVRDTVKETVKETLEDARERFEEVRDRITPKAADVLVAAADRITPDEVSARLRHREERSMPRWLLVVVAGAAAAGVLVVVSRMRGRARQEWPAYDTSRFPSDVAPNEPVEPEQRKVDKTVATAKSAVSDAVAEASDAFSETGERSS